MFNVINLQVGNHKTRPLKNVQFRSSPRKAKILTIGIHWVFRGLKFDPDAVIGRKGALCKGLKMEVDNDEAFFR